MKSFLFILLSVFLVQGCALYHDSTSMFVSAITPEKYKREVHWRLDPNYPKVSQGMDREEVLKLWGEPCSKNDVEGIHVYRHATGAKCNRQRHNIVIQYNLLYVGNRLHGIVYSPVCHECEGKYGKELFTCYDHIVSWSKK